MRSPYISRVKIKNFRNFKDIDISLNHKQVIIGENNVGKTNFIRALQLILDPRLTEEDRQLTANDFYSGLENPMENGEEIEVVIEIRGYEHNRTLLSVLSDATVSSSPPTLRLTYHYYSFERENGQRDYQFTIFQGTDPSNSFSNFHRKYFNIRVIHALRDVENEMRNSRRSPITQLLKQYEIEKDELERIAENLKKQSEVVLSLDELRDLTMNMNNRFGKIIGLHPDSQISLGTMDIDPNRILNTLKIMMGETKRPTSETSLGLTNILYISLILLSLEDNTVPSFLKSTRYNKLMEEENSEILIQCYRENENHNFHLKDNLDESTQKSLYDFMDTHNVTPKGFTILALEEPEAHLHPALQRIIYKDVMYGDSSVLMTTHSPYITSVAPLNSIVHLRWSNQGTIINTTNNLKLLPGEIHDLERYLDAKRGELYFGKGIILVEGIAEEYLIPRFAELLDKPLDLKGIIVCNINSTNFEPFSKFLDQLGIPFVAITDGDYYICEDNDPKKRNFHVLFDNNQLPQGYLGNEIVGKILVELGKIEEDDIPSGLAEQDELFAEHGFFVGYYTLEVDIMENCKAIKSAKDIISQVFNELTLGGTQQQQNFKIKLDKGLYFDCLKKIENSKNGIGKGRFAQRFSTFCEKAHIPTYIEDAIDQIYSKVDE